MELDKEVPGGTAQIDWRGKIARASIGSINSLQPTAINAAAERERCVVAMKVRYVSLSCLVEGREQWSAPGRLQQVEVFPIQTVGRPLSGKADARVRQEIANP